MTPMKTLQKFSTKNAKTTICVSTVETPVGKIVIAADNEYVYIISFEDSKNFEKMFQTLSKEISCDYKEQKNEVLMQLESEFADYFNGKLKKFTVPIKTIGSEFQKAMQIQTMQLNLKCKTVSAVYKISSKSVVSEIPEIYINTRTDRIQTECNRLNAPQEVWKKLQELPYASTQTYGELAKAMGRDASHARAVGAACGANAHLLVIPCHRLVASGSKGGFSCGVDRKEWLLNHEKKYAT